MIRIVRFVENVVEWRKQVAGKSCRKLCRVSDRIGSDMGSDQIGDLGKEPDPNWSLEQKRLGTKEGHVG